MSYSTYFSLPIYSCFAFPTWHICSFFLLRHTFLQIRYTTFFESFRESPTFAPSFHRTESDSRLPDLLLNLTGIIFSVSLCLNLTPIVSGLFSSFRDYTFQIFLLGIFPQIAIRILYSKIPQNELSYWSLYIISILLGIYLPVFIAKIVEKIPNKLIRRCFGL